MTHQMIKYSEIRDVHLEISSMCNASCPWCPRTFWGYPYNGGYPETNFTLANAKKVFDKQLLNQLRSININGNFGDIVMNPEGPEIVQYFRDNNPSLTIKISTNGSARSSDFWESLAKTGAEIYFCIEGLTDTHSLYRQNTVWETVIKNAKTVIDNGGIANWKMIRFNHNLHQISECRELSKSLGFKNFFIVNDGRDTCPVYNKDGVLTHTLGNYAGEMDFKVLFHKKKTDLVLLEDVTVDKIPKQEINCQSVIKRSIYISANGEVSPCCWTGMYPPTYGHGQYYQAVNSQLIPLIKKNNALEFPLKECIEWFSGFSDCWQKKTYEEGRLVICDDYCGK